MNTIVKFIVAAVSMGILDYAWLAYISKAFYAKEIGHLLSDKPNMLAAGAFYVIYLIGVIVFVINPALENKSVWHAVWFGALFGAVAYATYDLTNLATMKGFSVKVALIDIVWGAVLTAAVSVITCLVVRQMS